MDARDALGPGQGQGLRAGRQYENPVRDRSRLGVQLAVGGPQSGDLRTEPELDAEPFEVHVEGGVLGLAEQHRLGQRGPVVGLVGFGSQQGHGAGEALFTQGDRGLHTGHSGADDHDAALILFRLLAHTASLII